MTILKIRNKETGQFSSGGYYPEWEEYGMTYNNLKGLKCYLNHWKFPNTGKGKQKLQNWCIYKDVDSWEIVEFELKELAKDNPTNFFKRVKLGEI